MNTHVALGNLKPGIGSDLHAMIQKAIGADPVTQRVSRHGG